jgi:hypothetical protein
MFIEFIKGLLSGVGPPRDGRPPIEDHVFGDGARDVVVRGRHVHSQWKGYSVDEFIEVEDRVYRVVTHSKDGVTVGPRIGPDVLRRDHPKAARALGYVTREVYD